MSGWQGVLDDQLALFRFWRSDHGQGAGEAFGESMNRVEREMGNYYADDLAGNIASIEAHALIQADPFYVDPEMMDVIEASAETFQPEALHEMDFPTPSAFVVLPRPFYIIDRQERKCAFRAFLWRPMLFVDPRTKEELMGIVISMYSDIHDDDEYTKRMEEVGGGPDWRERWIAKTGTKWSLLHITPWFYGVDAPKGDEADKYVSWWPYVQAFLRLSMQTLSTRTQTRPDRGQLRRWQRMTKRKEDKYITVIRLRRPKRKNEDDPEPGNYSHRWIVNGHWRNQWFPSISLHRQIYIGAYVKGPEDKPLLVRRGRAFELVN